MNRLSLFIFCVHSFFTLGSAANAMVIKHPPLSVRSDLPRFNEWVIKTSEKLKSSKSPSKTGLTACAPVREVRGLVLCVGADDFSINLALTRASFWVEGNFGAPSRKLQSWKDEHLLNYLNSASGQDLRGEDLAAFAQDVRRSCPLAPEYCFNDHENELFGEIIFPMLKRRPDFALITYVASDSAWRFTAEHEIRHGQYFLNSCYRRTVNQFWSAAMTEADRTAMANNLRWAYDVTNEYLLINEFQSHLLGESPQFVSTGMVARLKGALLQKLSEAGCPALQTTEEPQRKILGPQTR